MTAYGIFYMFIVYPIYMFIYIMCAGQIKLVMYAMIGGAVMAACGLFRSNPNFKR